jgi:hypothetical protein
MSKGPSKQPPPRAGVNDAEAFVGDPVPQPSGLNPFDGRENDARGERDAALELLPRMMRQTSSHAVIEEPGSSRALILVAVLLGLAVAGIAGYVWMLR